MDKLHLAIIDPVGMKAGLDHYNNSLAGALNKKAYQTDVYSNYEGEIDTPFVKKHFQFKIEKSGRRILKFLFDYNSAFKKAKRDNVDVVVLHIFHFTFFNYLILKLAKKYGFRIILIVHDVESLIYKTSRMWIRNCVRISDYNIVHNNFTENELKKCIDPVDQKKIFIIPHGNFTDLVVGVDRIKSLDYFGLDYNKKYILFFGMIKKSKGLKILIDAMKEIDGNIHLIVAGRMREGSINEYDEIIKINNLTDRVHTFIRYITNEERNMLFNMSDMVILPYSRIYQSGILLLAMSYGIPVIASDLPANKNIIGNDNGILFKTDDASDLSLKINQLFSDKMKMKLLSENAKTYVEKNHGWDKIGNEFINILG